MATLRRIRNLSVEEMVDYVIENKKEEDPWNKFSVIPVFTLRTSQSTHRERSKPLDSKLQLPTTANSSRHVPEYHVSQKNFSAYNRANNRRKILFKDEPIKYFDLVGMENTKFKNSKTFDTKLSKKVQVSKFPDSELSGNLLMKAEEAKKFLRLEKVFQTVKNQDVQSPEPLPTRVIVKKRRKSPEPKITPKKLLENLSPEKTTPPHKRLRDRYLRQVTLKHTKTKNLTEQLVGELDSMLQRRWTKAKTLTSSSNSTPMNPHIPKPPMTAGNSFVINVKRNYR